MSPDAEVVRGKGMIGEKSAAAFRRVAHELGRAFIRPATTGLLPIACGVGR